MRRVIFWLFILVASVSVLGVACGEDDNSYVTNYDRVHQAARENLKNIQVAERATLNLEEFEDVGFQIYNFDGNRLETRRTYHVYATDEGIREKVYDWTNETELMWVVATDGNVQKVVRTLEDDNTVAIVGYRAGRYMNVPKDTSSRKQLILTKEELRATFQKGQRLYNETRKNLHLSVFATNEVTLPLRRVVQENDVVLFWARHPADKSYDYYSLTLSRSDFRTPKHGVFDKGFEESFILDDLNANDNEGEYLTFRSYNAMPLYSMYSPSGGDDLDDLIWVTKVDDDVVSFYEDEADSLNPYTQDELQELWNKARTSLAQVRDNLGLISIK